MALVHTDICTGLYKDEVGDKVDDMKAIYGNGILQGFCMATREGVTELHLESSSELHQPNLSEMHQLRSTCRLTKAADSPGAAATCLNFILTAKSCSTLYQAPKIFPSDWIGCGC